MLCTDSTCVSEYTAPSADAARRSRTERADGSGRYCGSGTPRVKTRSSSFQSCTKTTSIAGSRRKSPPSRAFVTGWLSPSVRTIASRAVDFGVKKRSPRSTASAFSDVAPVAKELRGGGFSMPIDRWRVASNTSWSAVGKRCGSNRSVSVATPTGMSGSDARTDVATARARSSRCGESTSRRASIERETSTTTNASASVRTVRSRVHSNTGCAAATPSSAAPSASAASGVATTRRGGWSTPRTSRTRPALRRARRRATRGTTIPSARSAPSGVRIVSDTSAQ